MTDINNFGAYAAIAVDAAGTEHAVWENGGQLWHAQFDDDANQWVDGAPITNAEGGRNLQLITGNLIPYGGSNDKFAPALVTLWEDASGELNYALGRFTETGELEWSDAVSFGAPTLNNESGTVIAQNPSAAITPLSSVQGNITKPAIAVVYEVVDARSEITASWRGTDSNGNPYQAIARFSGEDTNGDGILSGRSDESSLDDGIANELSSWSLQFIDPDGNILAAYDLAQQQTLDTFNFNYDPDNLVVLAKADAEVLSLSTTAYGLNIGLDRDAESSGDLWQLSSDADGDAIRLTRTQAGESNSQGIATTDLGNTVFTVGSSVVDDVDLYTEFISFSESSTDSIQDSAATPNPLTFEEVDKNNPPDFVRTGPEAQFLTADAVAQSSAGSTQSGSGQSPSISGSAPFGATQSFNLPLAAARRIFSGNIPLPTSGIFPSNSNRTVTLSGSIGATRSDKDTYTLSTKLALGVSPSFTDTPQKIAIRQRRGVAGQSSATGVPSQGTLTDRVTSNITVAVQVNSKYKPNEDGDLEYVQGDLVFSFGYGYTYSLRLQVPAKPSRAAGGLILGQVSLSYLNFTTRVDVAFDIEQPDPNAKNYPIRLPIYLEGNTDDRHSIKIVNDAFFPGDGINIAEGALSAFGGIFQLAALISNANDASNNPAGVTTLSQESSLLNNATLIIEAIIGLAYGLQIADEIGFLLDGAINDSAYSFDNLDLNFAYTPSLSGSVGLFGNSFKGGVSGNFSFGGGFDLFSNGALQLQARLAESLAASVSVFGWNWSWGWSANQTFRKNIIGSPPADLAADLEETPADSNVGTVGIIYSPKPGTTYLYGEKPLLGADATSQNQVDDVDVEVVADSNTGEIFTVWVAAGTDNTESLADSQDFIGRVLVSPLDSGNRGWDMPVLVSGESSSETAPPVSGFAFDPDGAFFYTDSDDFVAPSAIDFGNIDSSSVEVNRIVVWAFSEATADLDASSSSDEVVDAIQATDIYFSTSSRPLSGGTYSDWSAATLAFHLEGTDRLPTLGLDPDGTLRLAWVSDATVDQETVSTIFTSTFDPSSESWSDPAEVAQQSDLRVSRLLLDSFGDRPAIYWTDDIEPAYAVSVLQDDPGWYYRLHDGGSSVAVNFGSYGSSYNGTYVDGTVAIVSGVDDNEANSALLNPATGDGDLDAAAQFTSDGGYLVIPDGTALGQTFSLEFWVNFDSLEAGQILLQKQQIATDDNPDPAPDWSLKTGDGGILIFDAGFTGGTIETDRLDTDTWYYVVATLNTSFDGTEDTPFDGTEDTPVATLYLGDDAGKLQVVGQQQGSESPISTNSAIIAGQNVNGKLDELALYPSLLTLAAEVTTDDNGNVTNYNPSANDSGGISSHYAARFNLPESVVGDGTFFAVLEDSGWGDIASFRPENKSIPTEILLQRNPTFDVVSDTALEPDGTTDLRLNLTPVGGISPIIPNDTILSIQVVNSAQNQTWSTDWVSDGNLPLAVVQGGQLLNDSDGISKTLLSAADNLDLYFQGTAGEDSSYTVKITVAKPLTGAQETFSATFSSLSLVPNPSSSGQIGDITTANGDILEDEVSELAQIDSGLSLETAEDYVGSALLAGNFLTGGAAAIAVGAPFADIDGDGTGGDGAVLVLTAGDKDTLVDNNADVVVDPSTIPGNGTGIRIIASDITGGELGFALATGDIDGGGTDDLVIGAPFADGENGLVYVLLGENLSPGQTVDLSTSSNVAIISGFSSGAEAGYSLAVGKLNDDDYADIVIGAPFAQDAAGEVYVVYGSEGFSGTTSPDVLFTGEANSFAGFSVDVSAAQSDEDGSTVNSFSGDANADVIIGAPQYSKKVSFGDDFINSDASIPESAITALRDISAVVPDNNNFSVDDRLTLITGRTYVLFGDGRTLTTGLEEADLDGTTGAVLDGTPIFNTDVEAGHSVSGAGDLDGDGNEDLAIGAPGEGKGAGQVYVVAGGQDLSNNGISTPLNLAWESNLVIAGPEPHARTGSQVTDAGDFNGDQIDDLVLGSPQAGYSAGQAHVIFGNGGNSALWKLDEYSTAIALSPGGSSLLEIFNESDTLSTTPTPQVSTFVLNGSNPQDGLVIGKSTVDLDGETAIDTDGRKIITDDLLAADLFGNQLGIVFGHPWLNDEGSLKVNQLKSDQGLIVQQNAPMALTQKVELLGDLNRDGFDEILVSGKVDESLIIFGGGTKELLDQSLATRELTLRHEAPTEFASLGDTNGDGLQDIGAASNVLSKVLVVPKGGRGLIESNSAINFANNEEYTVEFLVKVDPSTGTDAPFFLAKGNPFGASQAGVPFAFRYFESGENAGKIRAFINDQKNLPSVGSNVRIDDGLFHHVALIKENNSLRLYVDGVVQNPIANTEPGQPPSSTQNDKPLTLGTLTDGSPEFNGSLDEVRIWRGARSPEEIQRNRIALEDASGALHLNGTTAFAQVEANEALNAFNNNSEFTVEAFIQVDPGGQKDTGFVSNQIINKWTGVNSDGYPFSIRYANETNTDNSGKIVAVRSDGTNGIELISTSDFSDGVGRHVALVKEGDSLKLYVNGVLEAEATDNIVNSIANEQPLTIGRRPSGTPTEFFTGKIDEIRIWNISRPPAEIQQNIVATISVPSEEPNLVTYLPMEGRVLQDESIQGANATLEGGAVLGIDDLSSATTELVAYYSMEDGKLTDLSVERNDGSIQSGAFIQEEEQFTILSLLTGDETIATAGSINLNNVTNTVLPPGLSLEPAQDFNGDGLNDWILKSESNAVNLYLGQRDGSIAVPVAISTPVASTVSDVNQDGFDDLVGINSNDQPVITFGKSDLTINPSSVTLSKLPVTSNSYKLTNAGDFNGDGKGDFGISPAGTSTVILAVSQESEETLRYQYLQLVDDNESPMRIDLAGDINGDGFDDLIIGSPTAPVEGKPNSGKIFTVFGSRFQTASSIIPLQELTPSTAVLLEDVLSLDGSSSSIATADYKGIIGGNPRTIEAWIRTTSTGVNIIEWGDGAQGKGRQWGLFIVNGVLRVGINDLAIDAQTRLNDGKWHHIAVALDSNVLQDARVYVDGVLQQNEIVADSSVRVDTAEGVDVVIGSFLGEIDEVRIWSEARSLDKINENRSNRLVGDEDHLELYYTFDETTASTVTDASINKRNGSLQGNADVVFGYALSSSITGIEDSLSGNSISGGKDVNGDGFSDFAVGTDFQDNLSYLLFGGDFTVNLTQGGTIANDVFEGTATGDRIIGNTGNDYFIGNGGEDVFYGGNGNDIFSVADSNFRRVDGGGGLDVLLLNGQTDQSWNLMDLAFGDRVRDIEAIDIRNYGSNVLTVDPVSLVNLSTTSNTLIVDADTDSNFGADLILDPEGIFEYSGIFSENGFNYDLYQAGNAILLVTPGVEVTQSIDDLDLVTEGSTALETNATQDEENSNSETPVVIELGEFFDAGARIFISEPAISEAEGLAEFSIVRSGNPNTWLTLNMETTDGSANDGIHFEGLRNEIIFEPGEVSKVLTVPVIDDGVLRQAVRSFQLQMTENIEIGGTFGNDILSGGDGDDILRGDGNGSEPGGATGGDDILSGGAGDDQLEGKGGDDILLGGAGDDTLSGDAGDDTLRGGLGNDILTGGGGVDTFELSVGEGTDTITDFELAVDKLALTGELTQAALTFGGSEIRFENEVLVVLTGVDVSDSRVQSLLFEGGDAQSQLVFGTGDDDIFDSAVAPNFTGINQLLFSGAGDDFVETVTNPAGLPSSRIYLGSGNDEQILGSGDRSFGGSGNDILDSSQGKGSNRLYGGDGDDELILGSRDRAYGNDGNDTLDSTLSEGGTRLYGGDGDDTFFLGTGDRAIAGEGNDRFFVGSGGENLVTGGVDSDEFWIVTGEIPTAANTITDFEAEIDKLGIGGLGIGFEDLTITSNGDTTVSLGGDDLAFLLGVSTIDSNSIIFS
ncbi:MAG: LamG-like jellyroll fold domain-containing protein [Cyanobacteria bacterium P01_H01_bin.15]